MRRALLSLQLRSESIRSVPVWPVVLVTLLIMAAGVGATALYLPDAMKSATIDSAYRGNLEVADLIKLTRGYYTRNVVAKALSTGALTPSFDHMQDPKAIPLPATFVKDLSDLLQKKDVTLSLISPYPWPHRADRKMDQFQSMAWQAFQQNPEAVFSRQEVQEGKRVLRVAVADRMTGSTCVECHNNHPQATRRGWKVGDVRAVMEVTKVVEPYLAAAEKRSSMIVVSLAITALIAALVLLSIMALVVRRAREKHLAERHIRYLAHHDSLTRTLNRASFARRFNEMLEGAEGGTAVAVYFIDLDRFKEVNDKFGHAAGDQLVLAVADRLRSLAGPGDLLARLGGDEFVLVRTQVRFAAEATETAAAIVRTLGMPFAVGDHQLSISASVGVMLPSDEASSADDLVRGADVALYRAKHEGRNRFVLFDPDMRDELVRRRRLENTVRRAAATGEFELYFQPIWNVATRSLAGFEALLRLRGDDGVPIRPDVFIPIAEQLGLIRQIGAWVILQACRHAAQWPEHLTIAVNLSPLQFKESADDEPVSRVVDAALATTGLAPGRLEIEVTEGLLLENSPGTAEQLRDLEALGVSLVMDDFGTGYSSLNYLWKFPFAKIKIDRSFVIASRSGGSKIAAIVSAMTTLARTLGIRVTVEGVETQEEIELFASLSCDQLQGFYLGRPMPQADVAAAVLQDFCARIGTNEERRAVAAA